MSDSPVFQLSTAHWPCASRTTATAIQSATLAQIVVLTSRWEVTFASATWCTARSTPNRGTKAQEVLLKPQCPRANEGHSAPAPFWTWSAACPSEAPTHLTRWQTLGWAVEVDAGLRNGRGYSLLITFNHTLQYYDLTFLPFLICALGLCFSYDPSCVVHLDTCI